IMDQLVCIRIEELESHVHLRAVVESHHQGETLLDQEAVGIHIRRIRETPRDDDTVTHKRLAQEIRSAGRIVRFHFLHQLTAAVLVVMMVMVIIPAPAHGSNHHEDADPPPASSYHGLPSLRCSQLGLNPTMALSEAIQSQEALYGETGCVRLK